MLSPQDCPWGMNRKTLLSSLAHWRKSLLMQLKIRTTPCRSNELSFSREVHCILHRQYECGRRWDVWWVPRKVFCSSSRRSFSSVSLHVSYGWLLYAYILLLISQQIIAFLFFLLQHNHWQTHRIQLCKERGGKVDCHWRESNIESK